MAFRQEQKKAQKQKVSQSPQLIKAIALLEKSNPEIQDGLDLEKITDAILEEVPIEPSDDGSVPDVDEDGRVKEDIGWDEYLPKDDTGRIEREIRQKALPPPESVSSELTYDLYSHLMSQLRLSKMNVVQKEIGAYLIGNLNEDGYLETSIEDLWQEKQRYELKTWFETLKLIQKFDPAGVAAKDLQECLLIQAKTRKLKNSIVEEIIGNHWDTFLNLKCDVIAKSLSIPMYDVHAAILVISSFDPRPGQRFNKNVYFNEQISPYNDSAFHIRPDFFIYKDGNNNYSIEPKSAYIDAIISDYYYKKFENGDPLTLMDITVYLRKQKKIKKSIIAIHNRHKNIINAIKSIVRFQKDFFDTGLITKLSPLIARDVANKINLDESTIRRIRKNKYVDTPHGIFELAFFFDKEGYNTRNGVKMASKGVKELIKNMIESEHKEKPHRDRKIADILRNHHNIKIEVRTVGKYRKAMGILPARLRKWPC
jgi:RNA polymerase sigma-54 factor